MAYGTLISFDTLATLNNSLVPEIGEDRVFQAIQDALTVHNQLVTEVQGTLVEDTTIRFGRYGGVDSMTMDEIDEGGRPDAQKITAGATLGLPMRLYGISVQWTKKFLQNATGAEMAVQFVSARDAHLRLVYREIRRALFGATNFTFTDVLTDSSALPVKRLINADSAALPLDPAGNSFNAATHTHYLATASLTASDLAALIETVVEHYASGTAVVYINRAQEAAVKALTGFTAYIDARLIAADNTVRTAGNLNPNLLYNRAIGIFSSGGDSAEVWVKPWIPANYIFAYIQGQPKPIRRRFRNAADAGLNIAAQDEDHPLRATTLEAEFGFGVWNRTNGAVLYTGGGSYVSPTIT